MTATFAAPRTEARYDIAGLLAALGDVPASTDPGLLRRSARDYFWYSPVLRRLLSGKTADLVVSPRDESDVVRVAAACFARRIPVTVRAGGTGNYGQAVPLDGGVVLDMSGLDKIEWMKPGLVRAGAGTRLHVLDRALRGSGSELRMHPSTKRMATIGGFIAGGSGGIGSVAWGVLRDPGNLIAARIVTMEETPRTLELRGPEVQAVNHGYGTTGIITALEIATAPASEWVDLVISFDDLAAAVGFGRELALANGIEKKLVTPIEAGITPNLGALTAHCPPGKAVLLAMVAAASMEPFRALLGIRGTVTHEQPFDDGPDREPVYEYSWNHTTLHWLKRDPTITYLQCLFPPDRLLDSIAEMKELFGDEVLYHLEFIRIGGQVTCSALPIVRFTNEDRLAEIIRLHEQNGVRIANPHTWTLEDGSGHKKADADQLGFKAAVDPRGLLNPGKLRSFQPQD